MVTTCPDTARLRGLRPTNSPSGLALSTFAVAYWKPALVRAALQELTPEHRGSGLVLPFSTVGSAGGNTPLPRVSRTGAIASCQMVAGLLPPKPPTFWFSLGLSTITLAVISGVEPTNAADQLSCEVPVLPAIWWPGTYARRAVWPGLPGSATLRSIWVSVFALPGAIASGVHLSCTRGAPSPPRTSLPSRSIRRVIGTTSQCVLLPKTVTYAVARPSGRVGS